MNTAIFDIVLQCIQSANQPDYPRVEKGENKYWNNTCENTLKLLQKDFVNI